MKKVFDTKGTFKAKTAAEKWLTDNGYSFGSSCVYSPQAIKKGNWNIAKWRNLTVEERKNIDGIITGNGREGPITVEIYEEVDNGSIKS
ncbi:MAG: hypothetical protein PF693_09945 [Spirochaetia bacterium]|jgi:hypothetical protein|nr:hypothetical protein [Spirochaetia bacterium]